MFALVTGASRGIGLDYARTLARDYGCDLLIVSRQEEVLQAVAADIAGDYGVQARIALKVVDEAKKPVVREELTDDD